VARELVATGWDDVALVTSRPDRAATLVDAFGEELRVVVSGDPRDQLPEGGLVVLAGGPQQQAELASQAVSVGDDVIAVTDDAATLESLLELDGPAASRGVRVVAGVGMSPGLSCLMASYGAEQFDVLDEVHVARVGTGGAMCRAERRRALRQGGREWRGGGWQRTRPGAGRELVWFPDPLGARDCYLVGTGEPVLLHRRSPELRRAVVRMAMSRRERLCVGLPSLLPASLVELLQGGGDRHGGIGGVRVELRGSRGSSRQTVVLGAIDLPSMATGAIVAEVAERLDLEAPGARGLGEWSDPGEVLSGLRDRGVRIAAADDAG
jgi:hypothetical protein